jgi:long-chain acyl-CoA synthetase
MATRSAALDHPGLRIDQLLARTAAAHPDQVAIRAGGRVTTYRDLDAAVTRCANRIRELTDGDQTVVAVGSILDPDYVTAYYAAIRSGNIALPVNPLLPAVALKYQLDDSGAGLAFLSAPMSERFARVAAGLAKPPQVVVFGDGQLLAGADGGPAPDDAGRYDPDELAALHFTSGTTGMPKAVMLSQRNVSANAAQVADALRIGAGSVCVIGFPTYHPMHMNATVIAGAEQVLTSDPDLVTAVRLANERRATHLFSLPAWLNGLASYAGQDDLRLDTVRFVGSGGAALSPAVAERLRDRLGVPVIQGYGLAETSPLTHVDDPEKPAPESVGPAVAGTECRIVGVESRAEMAPGEQGEIQLRGPQVMLGYLHHAESGIDADGWLTTGDVGYLDRDGRLFLVDRLKDVFKHDNFMVSPTEVESVLAGHPAVADCVVVDRPDEVHGAVAYAYIALRNEHPGPDQLREIIGWVNDQLPYFKHIGDAEVVPSVPRSPNGKVPRRELRGALHAQSDGGSKMVILLNRLTVTGDPEKFENVFEASSAFMRKQPGFMGHTLVKSLRDPGRYVNIAHWEQATDHIRSVQDPEFMEHITALAEVSSSDPDLYSIVQDIAHDTAKPPQAAPAQPAVDTETYVQIQHFYAWQSQLLDFNKFEEWAATFTEDGSFLAPGMPEPVRGRAALGAATRKNHEGIEPDLAIRHWFNMTTVEPRADGTLHALSYVIVLRTPRNGESIIYRSTICEDVLVLQDGRWLVRERVIRRDDLPS